MRLAAFMFLAGGVAAHQLPSLPPLALVLAPVGVAAFLCLLWRSQTPRAVLWLLLGAAWGVWQGQSIMGERLPVELQNRSFTVSGSVLEATHKTGLSRFVFHVDDHVDDQADHEPERQALPKKIRVAWYDPPAAPVAGERWRLRVRLRLPVGFSNPGGFDYEGWLFRQGIGATAYVLKSSENTRLGTVVLTQATLVWREAVSARIARLTRGLEHGAIIRALTVGDRSHMEARHWETLNATGTNHLLAISGLHVGLVAVFGFAVGRRLWGSFAPPGLRREQLGAVVGLLLAVVYAGLSGFAIPARRAVLMVGGALLALISARTVTPGQFLSGALLLILIADPLALLDAGLWLSFVAVASILWVVRQGPTALLRQWSLVQGAVGLALIPALLVFFQRVSMVAPLVNLFAIPVVAMLVVPLCLAGVAALFLNEDLAVALWLLADRVIDLMWWVLEAIAALPGVLWTTPSPGFAGVLAGSLGAAAILGPLRRVLWLPGCVLLGFLLLSVRDAPEYRQARVTLLDVGQGLSVVVETATHTLVYDAGPRFRSGFDTGSGVVAPYLRSRGISMIDLLVISHGDMDHRGGMPGLMNAIPVRERMMSGGAPGNDVRGCVRGEGWVWDGVEFQVLHPRLGLFVGNNASCVLHIKTAGAAVLLPGDIETAAESWLVRHAREDLKADVLIAPHHGSDSSSTLHFLEAVAPAHVLIPAGYGNRFGLPNGEVVDRYRSLSMEISISGCEGALIFNTGTPEPVPIYGWRVTGMKYWTLRPCADVLKGDQ